MENTKQKNNQKTKKDFSITEALRFGWQVKRQNFWFFVAVILIYWIVIFLPYPIGVLIINIFKGNLVIQSITSILAQVASAVLAAITGVGIIKISLKLVDQQEIAIKDLFSCYPLFLKYLLGLILYQLIVLVGLILLIVPGIIWFIKYGFWVYLIVDKNLGIIASLKESGRITQGVRWKLFLFGLVIASLIFFGVYLPLVVGFILPSFYGSSVLLIGIVGVFMFFPAAWVAIAFVYRKLAQQTESTLFNP